MTKTVTAARLGETFRCGERTLGALDSTIEKWESRFGKGTLRIVQGCYSLGPRSAGTHSEDNCIDFEVVGVDWWDAQWFLRDQCGMWVWFRHTGTWSGRNDWHLHGGWLPPGVGYGSSKEDIGRALAAVGWKVGEYVDGGWTTSGRIYTSSQIFDYLQKTFGLKGQHDSGADKSRFPRDVTKNIYDPEEDMALSAEDIERIAKRTAELVWAKKVPTEDAPQGRYVANAVAKTYDATVKKGGK